MFQRKPEKLLSPDQEQMVRQKVRDALLAATDVACRAIGCTGISFVIMGTQRWAEDLAELDQKAAAKFYRALADIYDPASTDGKRAVAERKRRHAVDRLRLALDVDMQTPTDGRPN
ncbi:MAG: hypothetical protein AAGF30_00475 [Pseudomonadota bacterium]